MQFDGTQQRESRRAPVPNREWVRGDAAPQPKVVASAMHPFMQHQIVRVTWCEALKYKRPRATLDGLRRWWMRKVFLLIFVNSGLFGGFVSCVGGFCPGMLVTRGLWDPAASGEPGVPQELLLQLVNVRALVVCPHVDVVEVG